jgi:hypothetical protein
LINFQFQISISRQILVTFSKPAMIVAVSQQEIGKVIDRISGLMDHNRGECFYDSWANGTFDIIEIISLPPSSR